jgi:hypothetical protein
MCRRKNFLAETWEMVCSDICMLRRILAISTRQMFVNVQRSLRALKVFQEQKKELACEL